MRATGIGLIYLLLIGLSGTDSLGHFTKTQEKHIWDLFKLHNVYIDARTSKPGFIFGAISKFGKKLVELVEIGRSVSLIVPLANGWSRRFTVPIQRNESSEVHILVVIGNEGITIAINCQLVFSESLRDINFVLLFLLKSYFILVGPKNNTQLYRKTGSVSTNADIHYGNLKKNSLYVSY
uniref:Secreted protein n=1 Tax=Heterorhabditis bacteriophora TaxID=37862 RepID=A0A1I7X1C3_HETBA